MKTVNFLEALEANKTREVKNLNDNRVYLVGQMYHYSWSIKDIKARWYLADKPLEIFVNLYEDKDICGLIYSSESQALNNKFDGYIRTARFVEVCVEDS